jgi:hypothetical protein
LIFGFLRPLSGFFSHDTYPAFWQSTGPLDGRRSGGSEKIRGAKQTLSVEKSPVKPDERRTKNHRTTKATPLESCKVAHSFSRQTPGGILIRFLFLRQCILRCSLSR